MASESIISLRKRSGVEVAFLLLPKLARARAAGRRLANYWRVQCRGEEFVSEIFRAKWKLDNDALVAECERITLDGVAVCHERDAARAECERLQASAAVVNASHVDAVTRALDAEAERDTLAARVAELEAALAATRGRLTALGAHVVREVCGLGDEPLKAYQVDRLAESLRLAVMRVNAEESQARARLNKESTDGPV